MTAENAFEPLPILDEVAARGDRSRRSRCSIALGVTHLALKLHRIQSQKNKDRQGLSLFEDDQADVYFEGYDLLR